MVAVLMTMQPELTTARKIAYRHILQYHHGVCGLQTSTAAANGMVGEQDTSHVRQIVLPSGTRHAVVYIFAHQNCTMLRSKLTLLSNLISCNHTITDEVVPHSNEKKQMAERRAAAAAAAAAAVWQGKQLICL